jgi:Ni,Fe-hydrogenase III small subunit
VNVFLGPDTKAKPNPEETNVFMGICQQHHAEMGKHLPGCPPHAEVIMKGLFSFFPDVERPRYADEHAEDKLEGMLMEVLKEN